MEQIEAGDVIKNDLSNAMAILVQKLVRTG